MAPGAMLSRPSATLPVFLDTRAAKACWDRPRGSMLANHAFAAGTSGAEWVVRECRESMAPNSSRYLPSTSTRVESVSPRTVGVYIGNAHAGSMWLTPGVSARK